ncbi:twin-arginine translocase TatA/TatE family subunit [Flavobacterium sp. 5]|uniref:Sec-independent protein translocase subunit TatA/TatB n=1 Tax=Flavobacterium sp. 5 TaxID=2035199 RepID=UPI000C2BF7E4|nr:twin-arginine translocase TatA/TatE family subunit [Flavobacterium sp. 5]PKB16060.1 sec-independent protein translocase protein TatA [Flavobacterium sp. 5]
MFGIGGGELVFILFIVLMLFGSDKVPEMARTMGKAMAQLKNATNDIKSEIQKGAEANGFDQKTLDDLTGGINSEINKAKNSLLGDSSSTFNGITDTFNNEITKTKESVTSGAINPDGTTILDDVTGPIKRQI